MIYAGPIDARMRIHAHTYRDDEVGRVGVPVRRVAQRWGGEVRLGLGGGPAKGHAPRGDEDDLGGHLEGVRRGLKKVGRG